jgi:hypothetical protein
MQFHYTFNHSFSTLARVSLQMNNWEPRTRFSTVEHVQQLDDDKLVFYRRKATSASFAEVWEQVVIDREAKTISTSIMGANRDGSTYTAQKDVVTGLEGDKARLDTYLWDVEGNGSGKIEMFKNLCVRMLKAVKFEQWSNEGEE